MKFELKVWRTDSPDPNAFEFCMFCETPMAALAHLSAESGLDYVRAECWYYPSGDVNDPAAHRQWALTID